MSVRFADVTKRFGSVVACDGVSLDLEPGQIHCLLGENGAGKSTLISMLSGLQQPDEGAIEVDGQCGAIASPAAALARGIAVVQQHSMLVPTMTVRENLLLALGSGLWLDEDQAARSLAAARTLLGAEIDPDALVGDLGLGQLQQLEIALALWREPRVLTLDEPTSMLTAREAQQLAVSLRELAARGVAVLLVTHKLHEAFALADTVTVLRAGRVALRLGADELRAGDQEALSERVLAAMFGGVREVGRAGVAAAPTPVTRPSAVAANARVVVSAEGLAAASGHRQAQQELAPVSLQVRAGEIVGVAGIDGNGQRELAELLAGQRPARVGQLLLDGEPITHLSVAARQRLGVRYVTDDRLHEGIVGGMSVAVNLLLKRIGEWRFCRFGRMDRRAAMTEATRLMESYDIRAPGPDARAGTLSGGNIQKLLLARELSGSPKAIVCHKPSYGLDLRTVRHVRETIRDYAEGGGAVLLISTDLDELLELSHRVLVMAGGRIVGEVSVDGRDGTDGRVSVDGAARDRIGQLMAGQATP